jgi:superfamily I DNA and RNA helicase
MKSSYFYHNLPYSDGEEPDWLVSLEEYSTGNNLRLYLLKYPVVDSEHAIYEKHFLLLSPGFKLCIVEEEDTDYFEYYEEDIKGDIRYLYQKYEYRTKMGLYSKVEQELITSKKLGVFTNVAGVMEELRLNDPIQKRKSELLVSLCIGSINEIAKVGVEVPETLVEKVRHKIQLFDGDQTRFIYDNRQKQKKIIKIQGLSGTGKTELLLHKLKELYSSSDDVKIFFTCHNRILASTLRIRIQQFFNYMKVQKQIDWDERLWCANAWGRNYEINSGLYRYICYHYGLTFHSYSYLTSFDQICKQAIDELKAQGEIKPAFDYIIVDESQDFDQNFEELCKIVTSKQVYMAGDVFQSIFAEHIAKAYNADYLLGKCYRTAPDTLMFAHALGLGLFEKKRYRWLKEEDWRTCGYSIKKEGDRMILTREPNIRFDGDEEKYASVKVYKRNSELSIPQVVCHLIEEMNAENSKSLTPNDVAIIFVDEKKGNYDLANQICIAIEDKFNWGTNKAYESKKPVQNTVLISNRNNVKGLEYPYVICITENIADNHQYRNSLYTMLTRSFIRSYLLITDPTYTIPSEIIDGLHQIKTTHSMNIKCADAEEEKEIGMRFEQAKRAISLKELLEQYLKDNNIGKTHVSKILDMLALVDLTGLEEDALLEKIGMAVSLLNIK